MINERFEQLIQALRLNKNTFSIEIGLSNSTTIGRIVNGTRKPSHEVIEKISLAFPNVNMNWLISGVGEMFLYSYDSLSNYKKDTLLDYIIMNCDDFKNEPKTEALFRILKTFNDVDHMKEINSRIDRLERLEREKEMKDQK